MALLRACPTRPLFEAYQNLVASAGGPDAFAASLREEGEDALAEAVLVHANCRTAAEWLSVPPTGHINA
jgi:hypothetical protein